VVPSDDSVAVLLTQIELGGPTGSQVIEGFWAAAAEHLTESAGGAQRNGRVS
jgi:hypothetical protein